MMIGQIAIPIRLLDKLICVVGAFVLTAMVFPPNDPPPVFPLYSRQDEEN